jgi:hypothetical protein
MGLILFFSRQVLEVNTFWQSLALEVFWIPVQMVYGFSLLTSPLQPWQTILCVMDTQWKVLLN